MENNIKPLDSNDFRSLIAKYSPYVKEVRRRLISTIIVFLVAAVIGFVFYEKIIRFLVGTISLKGVNIVFTSPFQFINLAFSCGAVTGLVVVIPYFIAQLLHFLKPALRDKEYKMLTRILPFSLILFIIGFLFGAIIMKWQIEIFLGRSVSLGIGNILDISGLLSTVFLTAALMGLGFQFPIILLLLLRIGILKSQQLRSKRMWIYLGSFFFAILLPPDSVLADVLLSLPLIFLFEFTIFLNYILSKNRAKVIA
jgi:sec-independent protein translocase protein TatC